MSVIGIDFGNESCYVAAAKAGGIETLANDYSLRATPSFVAFDGRKRIIGVAAKNQQVTNMKNTVSGFKRLLGRKFNDPHVQRELSSIPTKVEQRPDGGIGYKVNYLDQEQYFSPEQLTAMLFTKLKETSTTALQAQVNDCVITCPAYFTNSERKALLDAAQIAGLNVLRLMNETTATALSYGFYKQDLPDESKPRNVVFVDCGNSSLQVSVCAFTKGKLKMLASAWDQIGGRDFDSVLAEHFAKEFYDRYKLNANTNARAYLRLLTEIEKLKKQMSANSTKLPINIECFMDDVDVSSSMQRAQMEELCGHLFKRVEMTFVKLLQDSKLSLDDIHSVEVVGGTTRIPAIKQLIEQVFGKPASTTLNQDESVSRGAALQCAIMSPAVRVREFGVTDIQNYAVKVSWDGEGSQTGGEIEVFPAFHSAPFSRLLTLNRKEPFSMTVQYAQTIPFPDPVIGKWFIKDVKANERGEHQEVKVKVRINHHGLVLISSASLVDKKEEETANAGAAGEQNSAPSSEEKGNAGDQQQQQTGNGGEPMEVQQEACNENEEDNNTSTASSPGGQGWAQRVKGWFSSGNDKKKKATKLIELPMEVKTHGFSSPDLQNLVQQEAKMIANDARETQRVDARNALEEFVYDMRNKLQGGPLERYVLEADREAICSQLNDLENWLYEEGEDCDRDTYVNKLKGLHTQTDPIKERANDYENAPAAFDELNHSIQVARGAINEFKKGAAKYDHLTEAEFLNISEAADKAQKWLDSNMAKFTQTPRMHDSPVKVADIRHEVQTLNACVNSVINRPKPKPAAKPAPAKDANTAGAGEQNGENAEKENDKAAHNPMDDATMDVE
ncbi:heat shock 70 kDa protein 4 isoform X1 [Zeugodacus cucurbitae]|uniref:Heat shock 70 kDa protein 4L n=1 Tax=Zeugodacus cucurbitae TaxID=28588 RepID=A0A0A1XIN6_ZEUCU|nr:heat shock 70 kDa protein 4 isoform X1 [Zeugodacus cucurbitae]XP_011190139.1 heat shock 70 kDa protein 4 isoform X1 [Zeugodacus cucurbitae]XP_011190140.1 heat shock 70 kDa protein 4 isoform X1 [Zeugodacus cucurbitae]XP_011190141.1 heat shock 70 kDa protein 4 isoform X1 [Zeugodacus cucurbitae]XP_011190143.1 heat shock 70 kDa protein 4 isoform X1 [Zeugodacus cucurbitae]XP_028899181.1 heat shock 70 kDa protein 4 isoform X1 [Zeugodacus cucurbitae]